MNKINLECLIDFLHKNNFEYEYIDSHAIGRVSYYFQNNIILKFDESCVFIDLVTNVLVRFNLKYVESDWSVDCSCE
jgi:hypothetical protein